MNWQSDQLLDEAKRQVNDEGVFSPDQINNLLKVIDLIGKAIAKESECNKPSVTL